MSRVTTHRLVRGRSRSYNARRAIVRMDPTSSSSSSEPETTRREDRLESWKEIAAYLNRNVRTLHRWERDEGLPVHRHRHKELGSVFAYKSELDAWSSARSVEADVPALDERTAASPRSLLTVALALAVAAGVIGAIAYIVASRSHWLTGGASQIARLELVSSSPSLHRSPSLSPDGRTVAFVSDRAGTSQVWLKSLAGGDPIQLTFHQEPVVRPRWSRVGDQIVYSVQGRGIWSVPPLGGKPRQLVDVGWNPEISPDGRSLVFERQFSLWMANSDGTNPRQLRTLKSGYVAYYGNAWPTFSPDGARIAVFLGEKGIHGDYWIVPVDAGEPRRVTFDVTEGGPPAWTPDGKHLVVSSARAGSLTLWRIPVSGGIPEALTTGAGQDLDPDVSSDGRRVLFTNVKRIWSLVVHDTHTGSRRTLLETRTSVQCPRFSWDGRQLAFFGKNASGDTHVFTIDADGANLLQVTTDPRGLNIMPRWSNDNLALFYYQVNPSWSYRRIAATGGPSQEIARWKWEHEHEAETDPSSRRLAYSVIEQGQLRETRIRRLDDGEEMTLPVAVFQPRFSRDGRFIAGESRDRRLTVCEIGGGCRAITERLERGVKGTAWSKDAVRVFYLEPTSQEGWGELKSMSVDGRAQQTYGSFGPIGFLVMDFGISPRDEIAFAPYVESPHELWMLKLR
jgi:Tol biopolymer transport system component